MNQFYHVLQWIISLIAVGALCYFNYWVLKAVISMVLKERGAKYALIVFIVGMLSAATLQRMRIGFWDWPDVDYQIDEAKPDPANE